RVRVAPVMALAGTLAACGTYDARQSAPPATLPPVAYTAVVPPAAAPVVPPVAVPPAAPTTMSGQCTDRKSPQMLTFTHKGTPDQTITIAAVGDVLLHDSLQIQASKRRDGFSSLWAPVADLIAAADISFANFEGVAAADVTKKGTPSKPVGKIYDGAVYTGYPRFNAHPSVVKDLKKAGFDILQTANNHSLDRKSLGVDGTIDAITEAKLPWTGTRHSNNMSAPWHTVTPVIKNGRRYNVAWLACTYGTNMIRDTYKQVLHCYKDRAEVLAIIRDLSQRPDIHAVIATPHWGDEGAHKPNGKECKLAGEMAEAGATAIVGTQPHVMQPIEKLVTVNGREVPVAYSIGNFVSNQTALSARSSIILLLGLAPRSDIDKLAVTSVGWIPIRMVKDKGHQRAVAIDRFSGGITHRAHLLKHLPEGNLHPPSAPFWPPGFGETREAPGPIAAKSKNQ
ncbi:MAG: CapA family protein, partial [Alphaproteobacteria bacterium]|nr:CapA family protein [Alphaproteobacteria bacterium]